MARSLAPPPDPPPAPPPPRWLRQDAPQGVEGALFSAGAALAWLDPAARSEDPVGQLWRRRLALGAAAAVSRLEGRREEEAALRDHWVLRRPGDDPGPAGRLLAAWRRLGEPGALAGAGWAARLPAFFDLPEEEARPALAAALAAAVAPLPPAAAAAAAADLLRLGPRYRAPALWLADAVLARRLGWDRAVPLLPTHLPRAALRLEGEAFLAACATAWHQAALAALDLQAELMRRAARLRAVAPRLRGRDARATVAALLTEDALAAQAGARASDRAARRLFDRLTALGAARELTGRPTFRLYGL